LGAAGYLRGTLKLELANRELEDNVRERTQLLTSALADLKATQSQLIQSEKMVTLGQLLANVAHEINTPIGAIKSSGESISDALEKVLTNFLSLVMSLDKATRQSFAALLAAAQQPVIPLSTREERQNTRALSLELMNAGVADAQTKADLLIAMRITQEPMRYAVILHHARAKEILGLANQIATIINSTENINTAVDQVGKIVFALKSFSHTDHKQEFQKANLVNGLETVLTIYNNAIKQGVEVTRFYQNVGSVECLESELNQVWTNLIHNALQAMHNSGTLKVSVFAQDGGVAVSIADNGPGIPEDIKVQIFEPFFTTKPIGEGSGLGLDIVKKILDKHHGRIDLHSEIGVGTTFTVWLPLQQPAESGS
jgi:signal transduction histidine kinase